MTSLDDWKQKLLASPEVTQYINGLWGQLKSWLRTDMSRDDSVLRSKIAEGVLNFGAWLSANPALCASINDHMADAARSLASDLRDTIALHIANTVKNWDDSELVRELELSVGSDLQFIRINGTVVGGLIGVVLHALVVVL